MILYYDPSEIELFYLSIILSLPYVLVRSKDIKDKQEKA
jgi:hypothetical protein